ncbi:embigin isoform X2 [Pempheris klunzingeri]|uniref:embigin isoform X2 n=1 Tax=Pempheris klunzingeri TaxID=3127111 RepID=UPI00397ED718
MSATWKQPFPQILLLLVSCRHINTSESLTEKVELLNPVSLTLECTWAGDQDKNPNITGLWRKDGDEIENSQLTVPLENGQYNLKRVFNIVSEENLGSYSCVFGSEAKIDFVLAAPQIGEVRDKPIVSYVGDSVVIACKMEETKPKPNTWRWYKENGTDKEQIFTAAEPHRYEIKNEERKTKLLVHNLTKADTGLYYCGAVYAISTAMSHVELKVISFQEPLKPFIAIVVEVIVLVAAILLYERSQSKKNHTAGNGTNDQSNTVTQGENNGSEGSSSMRQRRV